MVKDVVVTTGEGVSSGDNGSGGGGSDEGGGGSDDNGGGGGGGGISGGGGGGNGDDGGGENQTKNQNHQNKEKEQNKEKANLFKSEFQKRNSEREEGGANIASAAAAPLLPYTQEDGTTSTKESISGAVFNISTSMIGAGIMSIPATLKVLGIIPGFVIILLMGLLVDVTVEFLLSYTHSGESSTYGGLMAESFGKVGSVAIQLCCMISNLGALIIYLIIIGDVLSGNESEGTMHLGILQEWFGIHWWNSRANALLFIVIFFMLPLLLLPLVESLAHVSALSILLAVVFVAISTGMAVYATWEGKTQKLRLIPDFANGVSVFQLFTTIPVFATGLACHVTIHPVRAELLESSNMTSAVQISLLLTVTIYFAVGFVGYLLFGDSINADMLVNFDHNFDSSFGFVVNDIVRLSYAVHLMLVFPVIHFTLRAKVDELMFPNKALLASDRMRFVSLTCVLLAFVYIVAVIIPNIWYFFQFMGSTTVACIVFVFPGAIVLRDVQGISERKDIVMAMVVISVAMVTSAVAISTSLYNSLGPKT